MYVMLCHCEALLCGISRPVWSDDDDDSMSLYVLLNLSTYVKLI